MAACLISAEALTRHLLFGVLRSSSQCRAVSCTWQFILYSVHIVVQSLYSFWIGVFVFVFVFTFASSTVGCCGQSTELIWVTALNYWLLIEDASTCQGQTRCSAEITNGQRHPGSSVFANTNTNWIKVFQQNTSTSKKCLSFPECSTVVFLNSM